MSPASRIGVLALALLVAGCVKQHSSEPAETCDRFGDAAGRCTVGAIEGVARYDGESAHEGIRVSVVGTDRHVATAEDGSFSLEKLPPGDYLVAMEAEGWTTAFAQATVRARQATVLEAVTLERPAIATSLGGRVLLAGRTDHAGTLVAIDGTGVGVFTAGDGSFEFRDVPFGAIRITARHAGFYTATFDLEVDRIAVDIGDRTLERLPLPGSLSGVVFVAGEPLGGVAVALTGTEFETQTGPDGTFLLDAVEPGTFELVAVAQGFLPASREVQIASERNTVVPAITLQPARDHGSLRGTARRLGELHHGGIEIRLLDGDRLLAEATTDEEGRYQLPEAPIGFRTLVLRAEGFPELRIPNVPLGPGDWSGPDAVLRRSVLVDPRSGDGMTTPSGRKAVISFFSGKYGTHVWDGDALHLRYAFPIPSLLVAVDSDETYATILVEDDGSAILLRLDLASAEVEVVSPRPTWLIGAFGGSTFYFDEHGVLHRIRAREAVATPVEVEVDDAWIADVSAGVAWIGISYPGGWEGGMRIPFDLDGDWHGPVLLGPFPPVEDRFFGKAEDLSLVWVDLVGKNTSPVSSPEAFGVHETSGGILFGDGWDEDTETFDLRFAR
ncbi:MAG TPA: carboxypeptidase regulatory-like domain-containing protein, partial [Vulgatibacter sp.]|nr:carboxypeptidase regulatory-like domain-containing protein [Vulgatibacter sp.]